MAVVVLQSGNSRKEATERPGITGSRVRVILNKSSSDLGFSLEGGVGSSSGDKPLTVQKIFRGGPVNEVFPGDELLEVQGQSLVGMMRLEAWSHIKKLPPGPVEVLLHRPQQPR
ncbi:pro-interleukin-16-like [Sinocyclocheilus grahami]|uniref:pro-interleukin-16-like n=1 Tax=Sinocyclocheilus grahami TaxID=75366 RepID=UPI0007ACDDFC|nr:PREDICTED: pro-interleukin-16-like [Sinocyclocheilus grahami]